MICFTVIYRISRKLSKNVISVVSIFFNVTFVQSNSHAHIKALVLQISCTVSTLFLYCLCEMFPEQCHIYTEPYGVCCACNYYLNTICCTSSSRFF
jgi:hypothetical protein